MTNSRTRTDDAASVALRQTAGSSAADSLRTVLEAQGFSDADLHLEPNQTFFEDEDSQRWLVTARLGRLGDHIEVIGMDVRSYRLDDEPHLADLLPVRENAVKLTAKTWRAVGALKDELRVNYRRDLDLSGDLDHADADVRAAWTAPHHHKVSRHERIAELYKWARSKGERPALVIAKELDISETAASKRIQRARMAGYLPTARPGKPTAAQKQADLSHEAINQSVPRPT